MKPGGSLPQKSFYPLEEASALAGCTVSDLVHYAGQSRITLLIGVPDGVALLVCEESTRKLSAPISSSPQMLSLSANQCLKLEMRGRIQQSDFVSGYALESDGNLKKLFPNSGRSDLDPQRFSWRLVRAGKACLLEILPEQLFVTRDDLLTLMGEGHERSVAPLVRKEKKPRSSSGGSADAQDTGVGGGRVDDSDGQAVGSQEEVFTAECRKAVAAEAKKSAEPVDAAFKSSPKGPVILRLKQVMERTGLARSTVYDFLSESSPRHDSSFPKQVRLGSSSVGWLENEVDAWVLARVAAARG